MTAQRAPRHDPGMIGAGSGNARRTRLTPVPSEAEVRTFDQHRALVLSLADEIMEADLDMLQTLARRVIAEARADGRTLGTVIPTGPALPFFDAVAMAPPDGLEPPLTKALDDLIAWYAA